MNIIAWRHFLRARLFRLLRRPHDAIAEYRLALAADRGFARAAHALAYLLADENRPGEAIQALRDAVRLEPANAAAWFNLGFLLHEREHQIDAAVPAFREAVRLDPKLDRAWYGLGLAHAALGDHAEAAKAFERVATLEPMNGHAWYQLGMSYHRLDNADKVKGVVEHLNCFERRLARQLIHDTGRGDLAHLVADLKA
ncbi:MAG: tetratricopeptide repeat protein [Gammaproteobacteria bacterium]|nr:MAG: tetratricopeptide repeat protein [Gammaproteobacteria bacterium]